MKGANQEERTKAREIYIQGIEEHVRAVKGRLRASKEKWEREKKIMQRKAFLISSKDLRYGPTGLACGDFFPHNHINCISVGGIGAIA